MQASVEALGRDADRMPAETALAFAIGAAREWLEGYPGLWNPLVAWLRAPMTPGRCDELADFLRRAREQRGFTVHALVRDALQLLAELAVRAGTPQQAPRLGVALQTPGGEAVRSPSTDAGETDL